MMHNNLFRHLLLGLYVLAFLALLFGLTQYSYRAKELLVCWLLFCFLFAVLALTLLAAVLASLAGRYLLKWLSVAKQVIPGLALRFAEVSQAAISSLQSLIAGPLKTPPGTSGSRDALETPSSVLIGAVLHLGPMSESEQTLSYTGTNMPLTVGVNGTGLGEGELQ